MANPNTCSTWPRSVCSEIESCSSLDISRCRCSQVVQCRVAGYTTSGPAGLVGDALLLLAWKRVFSDASLCLMKGCEPTRVRCDWHGGWLAFLVLLSSWFTHLVNFPTWGQSLPRSWLEKQDLMPKGTYLRIRVALQSLRRSSYLAMPRC
jgi:hypothetical protein